MKINSRQITLIVVISVIIIAILILQMQKSSQTSKQGDNKLIILEKSARVAAKQAKYQQASELQGVTSYLNLPKDQSTISLQENIGKKVILIDFWTYTCINCQRTLPYLKEWWSKYKDQGLLIIGVHSPEFEFEKKKENVEHALQQFNITYPVVQDNSFATWNAYNNRYWPAKYLIDIDGFIVYSHFGEGAYEETEKKIQELIEERAQVLKEKVEMNFTTVQPDRESTDFEKIGTPEIYFGYQFAQGRNLLGNKEGFSQEKEVFYNLPKENERKENYAYLEGTWYNNKDYMELKSDTGEITLKFEAKQVNVVAGSENPTLMQVSLDGNNQQSFSVQDHTPYNIISLEDYGKHELALEAKKGLRIYTFTFG